MQTNPIKIFPQNNGENDNCTPRKFGTFRIGILARKSGHDFHQKIYVLKMCQFVQMAITSFIDGQCMHPDSKKSYPVFERLVIEAQLRTPLDTIISDDLRGFRGP